MSNTYLLSSESVHNLFDICKQKPDEIAEHIYVPGIKNNHTFNKARLEENRTTIISMLNELPVEFHKSGGGGWSFLNACNNRYGEQWTNFHFNMEALFTMGLALGLVSELMPREMWDILPGGMPYYMIDTNA